MSIADTGPVNVLFEADLPTPLPDDRVVDVQQYQLYGVPRRDDFVRVDWPGVGLRSGVVYRVDWDTDGVPVIYLRS